MNTTGNLKADWWGCTVSYLSNFPYDGKDAYTIKKHELLKEQVKDLPRAGGGYTRCWVAILCSQQMIAKKILEDAGFKMLLSTESGHPEKPEGKQCNGGTIYLMWKEIPHSEYQKGS